MSTTSEKPPAAGELAAQAFRVQRAAEEILFQSGSRDDLTAIQIEILRQAGIEGFVAVEREFGRIEQVKIWMERAGSSGDLVAAEEQLAYATKVHGERAPDLLLKIDALQQELAELNAAHDAAAKRLESLNTAREMLRRLAPTYIQNALEHDRRAAGRPFDKRICEIRSTLALIEQLERTHANSQQAELHFEVIARPRGHGYKPGHRGVDPVLWQSYVKGRTAERAYLQPELEQLEAERTRAMEALGDPLDFYIKQLG